VSKNKCDFERDITERLAMPRMRSHSHRAMYENPLKRLETVNHPPGGSLLSYQGMNVEIMNAATP
jgi:hypothetical protein